MVVQHSLYLYVWYVGCVVYMCLVCMCVHTHVMYSVYILTHLSCSPG